MAISLASLIKPVTTAELETTILGLLQTLGFSTTSWQSGSVPLTLVKIAATTGAEVATHVSNLAQGGFLKLAAALKNADGTDLVEWLDLIAESQYQEPRTQAGSTVGKERLVDTASGGPFTIAVGQLTFAYTSNPVLRYTNITGGTLAQGGILDLDIRAESPGASYNVPNGTITTLLTPLPGVNVYNPVVIGSSWITTAGVDRESNTSLEQKCSTKWASIGSAASRDAYVYWAKKAAPTITRVVVVDDNPFGPGTVRLIIASAAGPATADELQDVKDYIGAVGAVDPNKGTKPDTTTVYVESAVNRAITLTATVKVLAANLTAAQSAAAANVLAYQQSLKGGDTVDVGLLYKQLTTPTGVVGATITAPLANYLLLPHEVPAITLTDFTWVPV
jgi:phage-related baseplate assembly protein